MPRMMSNFSSRSRRMNSDSPVKESKERVRDTVRLGTVKVEPFARRTVRKDVAGVFRRERRGVSKRAPERMKLLLAPVSNSARKGEETPLTFTSNMIRFDGGTGEMVETTYNEVVVRDGSVLCCSTAATEDVSSPIARPAATGVNGFFVVVPLEPEYARDAPLEQARGIQKGSDPSSSNGDK
jgi:hypothetical protein